MYDAKKDKDCRKQQLQHDCIGDRSYFYMHSHSNMVNINVSYIPIETITREFK